MNIKLIHGDSLQAMMDYEDNHFDVAIVDPPYGIKESSFRQAPSNCAAKKVKYNTMLWKQEKPTKEYFIELFRVSKSQIIWGGNYFTDNLPESRCWVVWDKCMQDTVFADVEMAWTSFNKSAKLFTYRWNGMLQQDMKNKEVRIHPTQKPVALYKWLLENFSKEGDLILDTHLGSGSIAIACHYMKRELIGYEIDKEYFDAASKRLKEQTAQTSLF